MPKREDIKKVLVIGSGPIVIGQAAEFDYAGTQACRALQEEGVEVVLVNSNPATIMTDKDIADKVYIEPLTAPVIEKIIEKEKPDSILPTLGGQAALNLAMELVESGYLEKSGVKLIGTSPSTIKKAEDRLEFQQTMEKIGEPIAAGQVVKTVEDGVEFAKVIGYPAVLRPAYTLGGSGGGIAHNQEELETILENGLRLSRVGEVLVERYIGGWKEVEYEVMRDENGTCITICNMENIDPVGVHTGDSIVVAPSQTLGDKEYQMLRTSALNIITELDVHGGCNVQYALNPDSFEYCVIEVNPRVSRSSALASKATGYPIAKVTAKIAIGYTLDEIENAVTKKTYASFEPMLDYCVVKMPRLPFDKFIHAKRTLTTQMKATGEVMSIGTNFEGALMKAIRSLEQHVDSLIFGDYDKLTDDELLKELGLIGWEHCPNRTEDCYQNVGYDQDGLAVNLLNVEGKSANANRNTELHNNGHRGCQMNIEAVRLQDGRGPGNDGVNQHVHREAKKHCGKGTSKHLLLKEECPRKLLNLTLVNTTLDFFLSNGPELGTSHFLGTSFKFAANLVRFVGATLHSQPTRRFLKEEEAGNYDCCTQDTADNEHRAPAEHGQNDHVHSGGNQSTAVSDQANVRLVLTALRGRSELGEGGVACGERSAKAQTHEEAAAGQERCIGGACSDEAEYGEDRTADKNRLLTADAVGKGTCHEATKEVANHGNGVEEGELLESHPTLGLKNVTDRAAYCHVNRVAECNASEQPQNLLVEASDGHTIQASCDAMVRRIQSIRSH